MGAALGYFSRPFMRVKILLVLVLPLLSSHAAAASILFIGNSFTYAQGSPVRYYRPQTVTDLNGDGTGGVPALFKSFSAQADLTYDVYLETEPGVGLDWHLKHKAGVIGRQSWDVVVMQGYSTLDSKKPGNPSALIAAVRELAGILRAKNPAVDLRLVSTWSRADQTYEANGAWYGKPIDTMAREVRAGYDLAAKATPGIKSVIPVGEAWTRAMQSGVADANPYDGIDAGKLDLWTYDNYHASVYGYYLEALMLFGGITGRDPRSLGESECSAFELGLSMVQAAALQQVAFDQLSAEGLVTTSARKSTPTPTPSRCAR
jgi:hypothetical protein